MNRSVSSSIEELLARGEGEAVEFKQSLADSRKLIETAAAMATRGGGVLLIGVRDDRVVLGANVGEGEIERFVQQLLANTDPRLYVTINEVEHQGRRVLCIEVPPGDGPHLAYGRAFHRVGRATVAMTRDEYERRLLDRLRESSGFERRLVENSTLADLDAELVQRWAQYARQRLSGLALAPEVRDVVGRLHVGSQGGVTVAGWLLFAKEPEARFPQAMVRIVVERGAYRDVLAVGGPVWRQIDETWAFLAKNLRTLASRTAPRREEEPELPLAALREVIANAVAHRDYRSTAPIQVRLTDDALDVWNPGALPAPLTPAMLRELHPSIPPNPILARALYLAGYIEEWGTGTLRVVEEMKTTRGVEPRFEVDQAGVRVVLPIATAKTLLSVAAKAGLKGVRVGQSFRSAEFAERAGVSLRKANHELNALERAGVVRRRGVGRAIRWERT